VYECALGATTAIRLSDRRWGGQPAHSERADGWLYLSFAELLLTGSREGACGYVGADVRDAEAILEQAARTLDFTKPVAVLLLAILHLIPDADSPAAIVARVAKGLAPAHTTASRAGCWRQRSLSAVQNRSGLNCDVFAHNPEVADSNPAPATKKSRSGA
jgi:S-adenosyl methyltransferase